jgi:glycosyltransferase involved in cell wall biosynthesis
MNSKISIILPSKNRVQNIINLCKSIRETTANTSNIELIIYIDKTDEESLKFFKNQIDTNTLKLNISVVTGTETKLSQMYNKAFAKSTGDIVMYAADDLYFNTKGWDFVVRQEFNRYKDRICLVFGYDGIQPPGTIATHGFVSRKSIETLGYLHPPKFGYNYTDNWLTEIYRQIDRLIYIPVYFEHRHWGVGKAPYDSTYKNGSDAPHQDSKDAWEDKESLSNDIEKLRSCKDE